MTLFTAAQIADRASTPHSGKFQVSDNHIIFNPDKLDTRFDWQLMKINFIELAHEKITLRLLLSRTSDDVVLYLGQNGGKTVGLINLADGEISDDQSIFISSNINPRGVEITAHFESVDGVVILGTAVDGNPIHSGVGGGFEIIELEINDVLPKFSRPSITAIDVGAAGGIESIWRMYVNDVHFVLIEPDPSAASHLRRVTSDLPSVTIVEAGLAESNGPRSLHVTRMEQCSSLLEPNTDELARYDVASAFHVKQVATVQCKRFDELEFEGAATPDYIKLDTQGTELEILRGFGDLLHNVLAIKTESHFYPIYKGQSRVGDLVDYLSTYGLRMKDMRVCRSFNDDFNEVDCVFLREIPASDDRFAKIEFIKEALRKDGFTIDWTDLGARLADEFTPKTDLNPPPMTP